MLSVTQQTVVIVMLKKIILQSVSVFFALTVMGLPLTASAQEMSAVSPSVVDVSGAATAWRDGRTDLNDNYQVQILLWKSQPQWDHSNWFVADEALPIVVPNIEIICSDQSGMRVSRWLTTWRTDWDTGIPTGMFFKNIITCWLTNGIVTNPSGNEYRGYYVGFVIGVKGNYEGGGGAGEITIPASKTCSASMNDLPLGTLLAGDSRTVRWPFTTRNGSIELSGSHIQSDGTLQLGGKSSVIVRPTNSLNVKDGNKWVAPEIWEGGDIPLSVNVSPGATGGVYQSVLTARLSCQ